MDPQTEKEIIKSLEAMREMSKETLKTLQDMRMSLKNMDNNIGKLVAKRPI
ncbi:MAG: hypothetical protein ACLP2P_05330 [Desulfobaccales bacterium]